MVHPSAATPDAPPAERTDSGPSRSLLLLLWIASLALLVSGIDRAVVQRTQEARVLETAREMLTADWRGWMIPRLNTELRLQKPPLAYWLAAWTYKATGTVDEWAGRLPFVLAGWLTLAVVYQIARLMFDRGVAAMSAMVMGSTFFCYRFSTIAETDVLATLFVATGVWTVVLARCEARPGRRLLWFHLMGLSVGLAALTKGLPAVFPLLFAVAWAALERDWRFLSRLGSSGGLVTAVIVGGAWFLYLRLQPEWEEVRNYLAVTTGGEDHPGPFYVYFPDMLKGTAPWSGVLVLGTIWLGTRLWEQWAARRAARLNAEKDEAEQGERLSMLPPRAGAEWDAGFRALSVWAAVIFVPLCLIGNKQFHYLLPMAGPAAVIMGVTVEWARRKSVDPRDRLGLVIVITGTVVTCLAAGPGLVYAGRMERELLKTVDLVMGATVLVSGLITIWVWRRRGLWAATRVLAVSAGLIMGGVFGWWFPSLEVVTHRTAAADLRRAFGDGPYVFYGKENVSYPLIFNLRTTAPRATTPEELARVLAREPRTAVIAQTKNNRTPPPIPPGLVERVKAEIGDEGMIIRGYEREGTRR